MIASTNWGWPHHPKEHSNPEKTRFYSLLFSKNVIFTCPRFPAECEADDVKTTVVTTWISSSTVWRLEGNPVKNVWLKAYCTFLTEHLILLLYIFFKSQNVITSFCFYMHSTYRLFQNVMLCLSFLNLVLQHIYIYTHFIYICHL